MKDFEAEAKKYENDMNQLAKDAELFVGILNHEIDAVRYAYGDQPASDVSVKLLKRFCNFMSTDDQWKNRIYTVDEPDTEVLNALGEADTSFDDEGVWYEVILGPAHHDDERDEDGTFDIPASCYDLEVQEIQAADEKAAFEIAAEQLKKRGWSGFKFEEASIDVL